MELHLPPSAQSCYVSGEPFVADERIVSLLVRPDGGETVERFDLREGAEAGFTPPGRVACRWRHLFTPRSTVNPDRTLKLTAENLFLTLADPANELSVEDTRLVQFLALMLERKRVLRPKGRSEDGGRLIYEHAGTKTRLEVAAGEFTPEFFLAVQDQLSVLLGDGAAAPDGSAAAAEPQAGSA
jgi:hypothetical protein